MSAGACPGPVLRGSDGRDHGVEHVDGLEQALDDVGAGSGLAQPEVRTPGDHLDLVIGVVRHRLGQVERAGHTVDQGHHVHGEVGLQRRVLVEVVQHHVGVGVALQGDDQAGHLPGRVVLDVGDAVEEAGVGQLADLLLDHLNRGLERDVGDHDACGATALVDFGVGAHLDRSLAGAVRVEDALAAQDLCASGEVGALHELHQVVGGGLGVLEHMHHGVDDLAQVVRRDVGGHAHRDPLGAVYEQVGKARREHDGLLGGAVVVGDEVNRLLVDAGQHLHGQGRQAALGVAHGGGAFLGAASAEVAVAVDEHVAQAEVLGHAGQGVVDGGVAVGMEVPHDLAHGLGALGVGPVGPQVLLVHRVQDPAVHGLEPVTYVGQRPGHDDGHGVLEERALHLLLDLDGLDRGWDRLGDLGPGPAVTTTPALGHVGLIPSYSSVT